MKKDVLDGSSERQALPAMHASQADHAPGRGRPDRAHAKLRILIVEDEPAMVAALRDNFEYEGFEVVSAVDGEAGLAQVDACNPDLVLLDVMMPRMSGLEVCKAIRASRPSLPIIM